MQISDRLQMIRGDKSKREFAQTLGIVQTTYNRFEAGDFPSEKLISKLFTDFKINPTWLLFGEGEMLISQTSEKEKADHEALQEKVKFLEEENKELTHLNRELTKHLLEEKNKVVNKTAIAG